MATNAVMSAEQYLKEYLSAEHPPEFVHGELIYRTMPKWQHGRLQMLLGARLTMVGLVASELHLRIAPEVIRIADLTLYLTDPGEEIPSTPPLVVAEIISPDDSHEELMRKLNDYRAWGVENIWVVEPRLMAFHIYDQRGLIQVDAFELPRLGFSVHSAELFAEATGR